jgi:hypothetical protein
LIFGFSFDDEIFIPVSVAVLEDQLSLGMVLQILLHRIDLGSFLMVAARSIVLAIFFPAATSLTMVIRVLGSPVTSTRPGCSVTSLWHTGVDTLADGD